MGLVIVGGSDYSWGMSWIELPLDDESPALVRATAAWTKEGKQVPSVIAAMKHNPKALRSVMQMNYAISFGGSVLERWTEEFIAVTVSAYNECFY